MTNCPRCTRAMETQVLPGHSGTSLTIDLCLPCQTFWFDAHESLQLPPAAVLTLFRVIGEHALTPRAPAAGNPACPRCGIRLLLTFDQQRTTRFEYLRCPREHGRLITFVNFLREKDFVRPMTAQQIDELRQNVQVVNCSNCGAPIDLTKSSTCAHCGSPLSMLDTKQAAALVAALHEAGEPRPIDPTLPLRLAQARHEVDAAFGSFQQRPGWFDDVSRGGLVAAGLNTLAQWLKEKL
jgi:hypothetical protein